MGGQMSEKIFAVCIGIVIVCTILMIASFIYRFYWEAKLKKEVYKMRTEPKENGTMTIEEIREMYFNGRENEKDSL